MTSSASGSSCKTSRSVPKANSAYDSPSSMSAPPRRPHKQAPRPHRREPSRKASTPAAPPCSPPVSASPSRSSRQRNSPAWWRARSSASALRRRGSRSRSEKRDRSRRTKGANMMRIDKKDKGVVWRALMVARYEKGWMGGVHRYDEQKGGGGLGPCGISSFLPASAPPSL